MQLNAEEVFAGLIVLQFVISGICVMQRIKVTAITNPRDYRNAIKREYVYRGLWAFNLLLLTGQIFFL